MGSCFLNEAGSLQPFHCLYDFRLLEVSVLIAVALPVTAAIALLLAIRLNTVQAMGILFLVFVAGWMSNYLFGSGGAGPVISPVLYGILPDWQHFWMGDALSGGGTVPPDYVGGAALYGGLYIAALLAIGTTVFAKSELK